MLAMPWLERPIGPQSKPGVSPGAKGGTSIKTHMHTRRHIVTHTRMRVCLNQLQDEDGSGAIDADELGAAFKLLGKPWCQQDWCSLQVAGQTLVPVDWCSL